MVPDDLKWDMEVLNCVDCNTVWIGVLPYGILWIDAMSHEIVQDGNTGILSDDTQVHFLTTHRYTF